MVQIEIKMEKSATQAPWFFAKCRQTFQTHGRLLLPSMLTALALSPFVLVHALQSWVGKYPFLVYVNFYLFFFPTPMTVGSYFESAILSIVAAALGLAICFLTLSGTVWIDGQGSIPYDSNSSRALGACTLVFLSFFGGILSSWIQKFKVPVRCGLFASTWALTSQFNRIQPSNFTDLFYPALVAMVVGTLANVLIFPRTARHTFFKLIVESLDVTSDLLMQAVDAFFGHHRVPPGRASPEPPSGHPNGNTKTSLERDSMGPSQTLLDLKTRLQTINARLDVSYHGASNEIAISRVPLHKFKVFIPAFSNIRAWIACGLGIEHHRHGKQDLFNTDDRGQADFLHPSNSIHHPHEKLDVQSFEPVIRDLCHQICKSLQVVRLCVQLCTGTIQPSPLIPAKQSYTEAHPTFDQRVTEPKQSNSANLSPPLDMKQVISEPDRAVLRQRNKLRDSISSLKRTLRDALGGIRTEPPPLNGDLADQDPQHMPEEFHVRRRRVVNLGDLQGEERLTEPKTTSSIHQAAHHPSSSSNGHKQPHPTNTSTRSDLDTLFRKELYSVSFLMVSLLEISFLIEACLRATQSLVRYWHAHPRRRVWMANATWRTWLKAHHPGPDGFVLATHHISSDLLHDGENDETDNPRDRMQGVSGYFDHDEESILYGLCATDRTGAEVTASKFSLSWFGQLSMRSIQRLSRSQRVLRSRIFISKRIWHLRHSRHVKFGLKLATGVIFLSLPYWLPPSSARQWWITKRGQWMVISFIYCLETSTGASFRVSVFRIIGTFSGSVLGFCISEISRNNPYALAFLLVLGCIPASYLVIFIQFQGIGIVMGLTYPIVSLIPSLGPAYGTESAVELAWNRGYMIFFGIIAALVVNVFVWPLHARVELVRQISRCTMQLQSLYLSLSRQMLIGGFVSSTKSTSAFEKLERNIEARILKATALVAVMEVEVSLVPKRIVVLSDILQHLQTIAELLRDLRRCREHGLRSIQQEAVKNVLELRQNMVGTVLVVLWSTGQALLTHSPLPQFLPSPRLALVELTEAVAEQIEERGHRQDPSGSNSRADDLPNAFHALNSLCGDERGGIGTSRHRHLHGIYTVRTAVNSGTTTPQQQGFSSKRSETPPHGASRRSLDYSSFFILAEHALLSEMVDSLEALVDLTRKLVGEATFLQTNYVPTTSGDYLHTNTSSLAHQHMDTSLAQSLQFQMELTGKTKLNNTGRKESAIDQRQQ